ncbi:MAG TPA: hypothetical protein VIW94_03505 [Acidimicrobiia bacterium]
MQRSVHETLDTKLNAMSGDDYRDLQSPGGGYGASQQAGTLYAGKGAPPKQKGAPPKKPPSKPSYLVDAEEALQRLPKTMELTKVVAWVKDQPQTKTTTESLAKVKKSVQFIDWSKYPTTGKRKKIREFLEMGEFAAWTRSQSKVYLSPLADGKDDDFFYAIVAHEVLHCIQFANNRGKPPKTIEEMCEFEYTTYGDTARLLPDSNSWKKGMQDSSESFELVLQDAHDSRGLSDKQRDAELRQWMEAAKLLPKDAGPVSDLY